MHRFYLMQVMPSIFGDWSLIREWGRVGSPGTVRNNWFETEREAVIAAQELCERKEERGYQSQFY